jgi:restriction endonuclease S subunit
MNNYEKKKKWLESITDKATDLQKQTAEIKQQIDLKIASIDDYLAKREIELEKAKKQYLKYCERVANA